MLYALIPFAFVSIPVFPCMHSIAMGFALVPLTDIRIVMEATPNSVA